MAKLNFNAAQVQPQQPFEPVPNNWYNVVIDESAVKPTNDGSGAYLELRLNIVDGDFANRKLFCRLNIQNASEKTVEIAYQQLSAICHATQTIQVNDSAELHGKPFAVKVVVRPPQNGYDASNEFKGFKACEGSPGAGGGDNQASNGSPSWVAKGNQQGNANASTAGDQQQDAQPDAQQNTAEAAAQPANNGSQNWNQNNGTNNQQPNNSQATVENTPAQNNGGGNNQSAPWMQNK